MKPSHKIPADDLPKNAWLERELTDEILKKKLNPHDPFPSESEILKRYRVSLSTVRHALGAMASKKLVYRRHGKGTFISPKGVDRKILVVHNEISGSRNPQFAFFYLSLTRELEESPYALVAMNHRRFETCIADIDLIHPEVKVVIFFRQFETLQKTKKALHTKKIPALFFGSEVHASELSDISSLMYQEAAVVEKAILHLRGRARKKIAIFGPGDPHYPTPALAQRVALAKKMMRNKKSSKESRSHFLPTLKDIGIEPDSQAPMDNYYRALFEWLSPRLTKGLDFDALFCVSDHYAAVAVQALERNGLRVPEDIAVLGVDNDFFCERFIPALSSVDIPMDKCAQLAAREALSLAHGNLSSNMARVPIRLVLRESA
jgi:DNA-binding LacI/PurR family transcriptional regulator